jgi:hypothetical protein
MHFHKKKKFIVLLFILSLIETLPRSYFGVKLQPNIIRIQVINYF